ncbi:hypothetical protein ACFFIO_12520 [Citricoccus parietis]|uniref:Uncharacterized protein n=1 Tax=Citricoccus parietis TaxID=592307 RepID=A0ABV6F8A2_9MICC
MTTDLRRRRPRTSTPTAARGFCGTEPRTASRSMSTGLTLRAAGLLAASTLVLTGCVSINVDGKASESPASTGSASSADSPTSSADAASAPATDGAGATGSPADVGNTAGDADEGFVALTLPEQDFPVGTVLSKEESLVAGAPFTMNLNLTGFTPEGDCAVLLDGINAFETQAVQGATAVYEADLEAVNTTGSAAPSVQLLVAQTAEPMEIMGIYSELPTACGTLESDEQAGATATFEQLDGLDATYLTISDGQGGQSTLVAGGRSLGDHHVYGVLSGVSRGDADAILQAQVDHVEAVLQDSGDTV